MSRRQVCSEAPTSFDIKHGWAICRGCTRALLTTPVGGVMRQHQIRNERTRSLDKTRDTLVAAGIPPARDMTRDTPRDIAPARNYSYPEPSSDSYS